MPIKKRRISIRITYEPNRLSKGNLTAAYEVLIPKIKSSFEIDVISSNPTEHDMLLKQVKGEVA